MQLLRFFQRLTALFLTVVFTITTSAVGLGDIPSSSQIFHPFLANAKPLVNSKTLLDDFERELDALAAGRPFQAKSELRSNQQSLRGGSLEPTRQSVELGIASALSGALPRNDKRSELRTRLFNRRTFFKIFTAGIFGLTSCVSNELTSDDVFDGILVPPIPDDIPKTPRLIYERGSIKIEILDNYQDPSLQFNPEEIRILFDTLNKIPESHLRTIRWIATRPEISPNVGGEMRYEGIIAYVKTSSDDSSDAKSTAAREISFGRHMNQKNAADYKVVFNQLGPGLAHEIGHHVHLLSELLTAEQRQKWRELHEQSLADDATNSLFYNFVESSWFDDPNDYTDRYSEYSRELLLKLGIPYGLSDHTEDFASIYANWVNDSESFLAEAQSRSEAGYPLLLQKILSVVSTFEQDGQVLFFKNNPILGKLEVSQRPATSIYSDSRSELRAQDANWKSLFLATTLGMFRRPAFINWLVYEPAQVLEWLKSEATDIVREQSDDINFRRERFKEALLLLEGLLQGNYGRYKSRLKSHDKDITGTIAEIYQILEWPSEVLIPNAEFLSRNQEEVEKFFQLFLNRDEMIDYRIMRTAVSDVYGTEEVDGIFEEVKYAFLNIPRHLFIPRYHHESQWWQDHPLEIGYGQTISSLSIVATMLALLNVQPTDKVLEVGSGSGWVAALLSHLAREVYSIERIDNLTLRAQRTVQNMGLTAHIANADGSNGYERGAPYDAIIVSAGSPWISPELVKQLREGGRLIAPVATGKMIRQPFGSQQIEYQLVLYVKKNGELTELARVLLPVSFVPLRGKSGWSSERSELRSLTQEEIISAVASRMILSLSDETFDRFYKNVISSAAGLNSIRFAIREEVAKYLRQYLFEQKLISDPNETNLDSKLIDKIQFEVLHFISLTPKSPAGRIVRELRALFRDDQRLAAMSDWVTDLMAVVPPSVRTGTGSESQAPLTPEKRSKNVTNALNLLAEVISKLKKLKYMTDVNKYATPAFKALDGGDYREARAKIETLVSNLEQSSKADPKIAAVLSVLQNNILPLIPRSELRQGSDEIPDQYINELRAKFLAEQFTPETALYPASGSDKESVELLLSLFPTLREMILVDPKYAELIETQDGIEHLLQSFEFERVSDGEMIRSSTPSEHLSILVKTKTPEQRTFVLRIAGHDYLKFSAQSDVTWVRLPDEGGVLSDRSDFWEKIAFDTKSGGFLLVGAYAKLPFGAAKHRLSLFSAYTDPNDFNGSRFRANAETAEIAMRNDLFVYRVGSNSGRAELRLRQNPLNSKILEGFRARIGRVSERALSAAQRDHENVIQSIRRYLDPAKANVRANEAVILGRHLVTENGLFTIASEVIHEFGGAGALIQTNGIEEPLVSEVYSAREAGDKIVIAQDYPEAVKKLKELGFTHFHFILAEEDASPELEKLGRITVLNDEQISGLLAKFESIIAEVRSELRLAEAA